MGIAFQALKTIRPFWQRIRWIEQYFSNSVCFICKFRWEIDFEHITPDYKHRISNDLLAAAKSLNKVMKKLLFGICILFAFLDFHRVKVKE
jgi:hypothetical protein